MPANAISSQPPGGAVLIFDKALKRRQDEDYIVISDSESDSEIEIDDAGREPVGVSDGGLLVFEVERILTMRTVSRGRQFLIKWRGWSKERASWKYEDELDACQPLVYEYLERRALSRRRRHH